jgi:hypothetical protein
VDTIPRNSANFAPYMWRNRFKPLPAGKFVLHGCDLQMFREHYMQVLQKFAEPGGDPLAGTFWREKDSISGFLSWTKSTLKFYGWGPSGTSARNRAALS